MNYLFSINTEGQFHTWKNLIKYLQDNGDVVTILARNYGQNINLMRQNKYKHILLEPSDSPYLKILDIFKYLKFSIAAKQIINPDYVLGFGIDAGVIARVCGCPCIIFNDSESLGLQNFIIKQLGTTIITPSKLGISFGSKHLRINSYKELAYLHPQEYQPDPSILVKLGIGNGLRYIILRFNCFNAIHDIGHQGFSLKQKHMLVKLLHTRTRVFISSETKLPDELKSYELPIEPNQIHDALYYASLLITDTQTMATEGAVLGVPVIRFNSFAGVKDMSNFIELEKEYGLVFSFHDYCKAANKALEVVSWGDQKNHWDNNRNLLINNKINLTQYLIKLTQGLPKS